MKYANLDLGTIEGIVNKLGGMEGVQRFLSGEMATSTTAVDSFDITKLTLVPILDPDENSVPLAEAILRGQSNPATNHGKDIAEQICAAGNAEKISEEIWPVGKYILIPKDSWRLGGARCAWYVVRYRDGFYCDFYWFSVDVDADGQFASLSK